MVLLFVYGSLRHEMFSHWRLDNDTYLGLYKTKEMYYMVGQISKSYPFVSRDQIFPETLPCQIVGEVYDVSPTTLAVLDLLEDHPNKYVRQLVTIVLDNDTDDTDETNTSAFIYLLESEERKKEMQNSSRFVPIKDGDWVKFCIE
jgi:gamma-glutamylcyclotransferase (GGCT)/AIG2-like uncharacterized protein YtfP